MSRRLAYLSMSIHSSNQPTPSDEPSRAEPSRAEPSREAQGQVGDNAGDSAWRCQRERGRLLSLCLFSFFLSFFLVGKHTPFLSFVRAPPAPAPPPPPAVPPPLPPPARAWTHSSDGGFESSSPTYIHTYTGPCFVPCTSLSLSPSPCQVRRAALPNKRDPFGHGHRPLSSPLQEGNRGDEGRQSGGFDCYEESELYWGCCMCVCVCVCVCALNR